MMKFDLIRSMWKLIWAALALTLASCAYYQPSKTNLSTAVPVTIQDLADQPETYHGKTILVEGCLDFHGSHEYELWNFDLSGRPPIIVNDSVFGLFVDGKYIPRKYRAMDKERVTRTGETTFLYETINERDIYVRLIGKFSNRKAPLNTGGHIVFADHFEGRIDDAKIVNVLEIRCDL
ncbi:hypothetical protein ACJ3XI_06085 [Litorimonas sp. RW-G-Af-16]|uniref:hypothetical protein n=1 Tax=Litorimonas sp. RW-G-Af-16 TaxID=3241168 RepID=UPI00390C5AC3